MTGENKQPDLEWPAELKPFVRAVEKGMKKHGIGSMITDAGKVTHIYYKEQPMEQKSQGKALKESE